jgi:hypothetical protein
MGSELNRAIWKGVTEKSRCIIRTLSSVLQRNSTLKWRSKSGRRHTLECLPMCGVRCAACSRAWDLANCATTLILPDFEARATASSPTLTFTFSCTFAVGSLLSVLCISPIFLTIRHCLKPTLDGSVAGLNLEIRTISLRLSCHEIHHVVFEHRLQAGSMLWGRKMRVDQLSVLA